MLRRPLRGPLAVVGGQARTQQLLDRLESGGVLRSADVDLANKIGGVVGGVGPARVTGPRGAGVVAADEEEDWFLGGGVEGEAEMVVAVRLD